MIQLQFLNRLVQTGNASLITHNNLTDEFFSDYTDEFKYIKSHLDQYGTIPDPETFLAKFQHFTYVDVKESDDYLLKALYDDLNKRKIALAFNTKIRPKLMSGDIDAVLNEVSNLAQNVTASRGIHADDIFTDFTRFDEYRDRTMNLGKYFITTGIPELDEIFGGWDRQNELATIVARTNQGKCLAKGTGVLMADGTVKNVEDVKVGDKVQSLNRVNTVLGLHNGISNGWKIIPNIGDPFVVSSNHMLTVVDFNGVLVDITVEDYLNLSEDTKNKYGLYRPAIEYENKQFDIEPYSKGKSLNGMYGIPIEYLTSSKSQRSALFSGILDRFGKVSCDGYTVQVKCEALAKQIAQLARGLGYSAEVRYENDFCLVQIWNLSRNTVAIPFTVEPIEEVEYYGFMCDGDSRYLLWDNTLTHNTWLLLKSALEAAKAGYRVGLYSGEMTRSKVGYRLDTLDAHISNIALNHGDPAIMAEYNKYQDDLKNGKIKGSLRVLTPESAGGSVGVATLKSFIQLYKLDILFIDQHSLLEDDRHGKGPVEKAADISKDLKLLQVTEHIPIVSVCQQNRESTEETGVTLAHIANSDRIGQDSTIVLSFEQKDGVLTIQVLKSRDTAVGKKLCYFIDFNTGTFTYKPSEDDAKDGQDCEALKEEWGDPEKNMF